MSENRFNSEMGSEYELFKLACPHYEELQNSVGFLINENYKNSDIRRINVLEVGFGDGSTSEKILNSDDRIFLTAIDNERIMLEKISKKLKDIDKTRYEVIIEDATEFLKSCESEKFDCVVSAWTIHNFLNEHRSEFIRELYRVLKKGGIFINADKIQTTDKRQNEENLEIEISRFDVFEKIGKPELKKEWTEHYLEDIKPDRVLIEDEFERMVKQTGFISFKVKNRWNNDATVLITK